MNIHQTSNSAGVKMNIKIRSYLFLLFMSLTLISSGLYAEEKNGDKNPRLNKTTGSPIRAWMNINNISTLIKNDGISDIDASQTNSGFEYPKGSGKQAVYTTGLLWGTMIEGDNNPRVGGSVHRSGLQPGKILDDGTPEDTEAPHVRIYRVRRDIIPENGPRSDDYQDPSLDAEEILEGRSATAIKEQYYIDWNEWRAQDGAPYEDMDGDGQYNPDVDIPGFPGADQTIWYVANDVNSGLTTFLYGTQPIGIEMQVTMWAYGQTGALGNMYFRKYVLKNKSRTAANPDGLTYNDMYISLWSDPDVGNSVDDFVGCDTTLSLSFAYNANASDPTYDPLPPPAVGYDFFQGPLLDGIAGEDRNKNGIDDAEDYGIFDGERVGPGKINLPMTAFYYFARGDATVTDPDQQTIQGAQQYYNFFQGKVGKTGEYFVNPVDGQPTTFVLTGDPQTRTGWIDGMVLPADDRRMGMVAGPITMEPDETQEIVVAEIAAGAIEGVDRLAALGVLKFYDKQAQLAYDNFFDLPVPPPAPDVDPVEQDREIVLDWSKDQIKVNATELFDEKGYTFQGYNVYQLPSTSADKSAGKLIATYDINDGTAKIWDNVFDVSTGSVVNIPVQFGNDTGIKRYLRIDRDELKGGTPLINGVRYYFAVTAYSYNPDPEAVPNNLENPLKVVTVVPHSLNPGNTMGESAEENLDIDHVGLSDGEVSIKVVDPTVMTGHEYEVYFDEQSYVIDENGIWEPIDSPGLHRDVTGSTIDMAGTYGEGGSMDINCTFNLEGTGNWVDGVQLTFPEGVIINSSTEPEPHGGSGSVLIPNIEGNVLTMGHNDGSTDGGFGGGEQWVVNISGASLPFDVDYVIWDDEWDGTEVDANGTTTISEVSLGYKTEQHWNLRDNTTGVVLLEDQTVINGVDIYTGQWYGTEAAPILDGFQISVNVNYAAPTSIGRATLNGDDMPPDTEGDFVDADGRFDLLDYTAFGDPNGTSNLKEGYGSLDVNDLQQDYEFRFTGEMDSTIINGHLVYITKEGTGSMATFYDARQYDIEDHPLNPNPGSDARFLVRVPFEVWNIDQGIQVNYQIYDRGQTNDDINADGFYVWNPYARMYAEVLNTPYVEQIADPAVDGDNYTWNHAWFSSDWETGDTLRVYYDNPIILGTDTYKFNTTPLAYSSTLAKEELEKINVFPNPYYGVNSEEINKYNKFVTFSHLPDQAIIRIFNLAGVMIRTIEKDSEDQFQRWDLANDSGLPVASGLYIAYIEMPEIGETKILKLAIIQEQQILDRF